MSMMHIRISTDMHRWLTTEAKRRDMNVSQLLRLLVREEQGRSAKRLTDPEPVEWTPRAAQ